MTKPYENAQCIIALNAMIYGFAIESKKFKKKKAAARGNTNRLATLYQEYRKLSEYIRCYTLAKAILYGKEYKTVETKSRFKPNLYLIIKILQLHCPQYPYIIWDISIVSDWVNGKTQHLPYYMSDSEISYTYRLVKAKPNVFFNHNESFPFNLF